MKAIPKFGQVITNTSAAESNPMRTGFFVREINRTGRLNPGRCFEITDGEGNFWETSAAAVDVPVEAQETAWLIERTGPQWFCISGDRPFWSSDSLLALRFSRERDAKHAMAILNLYQHHGLCATEHRWGL